MLAHFELPFDSLFLRNKEFRNITNDMRMLVAGDPASVLSDLSESKKMEERKREEKLRDIAASITTTSSRRRSYMQEQVGVI